MHLAFVQPAWLWALLLLVPGWLLSWRALNRRDMVRRALSVSVRSLIILALVLGLAGAAWQANATQLTTVFVVDSSDSIDPSARAAAETYIQTALRAMPTGDRAGVVTFGAYPLVDRPPSDNREWTHIAVQPPAQYTDVEQALRLAIALGPGETRKQIVLLSDGGENRGHATDVTTVARATGIPVQTVFLSRAAGTNDVLLESLEAPAAVRERQPIHLMVHARSTVPTTAQLRLFLDRQSVLTTTVQLGVGTTTLPITVPSPVSGFHSWEAHVDAPGDAISANNVAFAFSRVEGVPRIALVSGPAAHVDNLAVALRDAHFEVDVLAPNQLPASLTALDAYGAIALAGVPYRDLPGGVVKLLPAYVRELGHGLLMVGGQDSFAAGGYLNTPIETALPVTMRTRGVVVQPDVAIALIIDHSGSMAGDKLDLAREGAMQAFEALGDNDQIGVIQFDTAADWVVPLQQRPPSDQFAQALNGIGAGGGTDLRPGLALATEALKQAKAKIKHVVLLTDGQADHNYDDVVAQLQANNITLSTVGVGDGYDPHLKDIAPITGGRFYEALQAQDIPQLFFDEAVRIARRGIVEHDFTPQLAAPAAALRDLPALPTLHGYNAVTAKDTARVILASDTDDPILVDWQFGLGHAAAWTSDFQGQWGRDWIGWDDFARFTAQLFDSLLPGPQPTDWQATTSIEGDALAVDLQHSSADAVTPDITPTGRLIGPDGKVLQTPLRAVGPGHFRGTLPLPDAGIYQAQVIITGADGQPAGVVQTGAIVPPSAEYLQPDGNPDLLSALATATGGQAGVEASAIWHVNVPPARTSTPLTWPLLWLACLLWPFDIAVRRLLAPRRTLRQVLADISPAPVSKGRGVDSRIRASLRRHTNSTTTLPAPPQSPAAAQRSQVGPQPAFDWRSTRRTRVERPTDHEPPSP